MLERKNFNNGQGEGERTLAERKERVMAKERKTSLAKGKECAHPWDAL